VADAGVHNQALNAGNAGNGFHDIKPLPQFHPFPVRLWAGGALVIALLLLGWLLWRRRKSRVFPQAAQQPELPPYEAALSEFRRLELLRKDKRIALRDYASSASLTLRLYLQRTFLFPAVEQTVSEVAADLPAQLKKSLPVLSRERAAEFAAEARGRLKFYERVAFANDSGELYHLESSELLDATERSLALLKDLENLRMKEQERVRSVVDTSGSTAEKREAEHGPF
jgi:hypothetical protein